MKIRFACYQAVSFIHGGPYIAITETKKSLEQMGVEIDYFNMWDPKEEILNYDLMQIFSANLGVYSLARNLKDRNVKFVVMPIFFTRHSAKMVRMVNFIDQLTRRTVRGVWWDWGFIRDVCNWSEAVLPNTKAEGNMLEKGLNIPGKKIHVIPNGVSDKFLGADPTLFKEKYGIDDFILNVGHIGPDRKNVLSLIRALKEIDHPAVIIGQITPSRETELCLKEAEKNKNLLIIDGLNHQSPLLASAYAACRVFALPSKFETPGIAALEAALTGANVVITPHGGTKEYFSDYAEYVDPYSITSIRQGIENALNKPGNAALKAHIKNNFLWNKIAEKTFEVYKKVLNGS